MSTRAGARLSVWSRVRIIQIVNRSNRRILERLVGSRVEILCEGPSKTNPNRLAGRTRGNKIVVFEGSSEHVGKLVKIQIRRSTGYTLYGEPVRAAE